MDSGADPSVAEIVAELRALREGQRSVMLATADADGEPEASYAPYLRDNGDFYLFVSGLARHTRNLLASGRAALLFIEPEEQARQIFARRRLSYRCAVSEVERADPDWPRLLAGFEDRFGPVMEMLRGLPDFRLLRLRPTGGRYVRGFGQAYELTGPQLEELAPISNAPITGRDP